MAETLAFEDTGYLDPLYGRGVYAPITVHRHRLRYDRNVSVSGHLPPIAPTTCLCGHDNLADVG